MSKIGKKPIVLLPEAKVEIAGGKILIEGAAGRLELIIPREIKVERNGEELLVTRTSDEKKVKMLHGGFRQILANGIKGVVSGWRKILEVRGVGFRVSLEGQDLIFNLGFSHPVKFICPEGVKFEVKENKIDVIGPDKSLVGLVSDKVRKICPPDPYKGKGIRYADEQITLKPGKSAKVGAATAATGAAK